MKPRKDSADKEAGSGCMARLVRFSSLRDSRGMTAKHFDGMAIPPFYTEDGVEVAVDECEKMYNPKQFAVVPQSLCKEQWEPLTATDCAKDGYSFDSLIHIDSVECPRSVLLAIDLLPEPMSEEKAPTQRELNSEPSMLDQKPSNLSALRQENDRNPNRPQESSARPVRPTQPHVENPTSQHDQ